MNILSLILFPISLSIDSFGIGVSYGIRKIKIHLIPKLIISIISFLVTYISIFFGNIILNHIDNLLAKIIGTAMLFIYGIITIYQGKKQQSIDCDFNSSKNIEIKESLYLGLALSIDSFGGCLSYVISGYNPNFIPILVGSLQFLFLSVGSIIGKKISDHTKIKPNKLIIISGIIFIFLALLRLIP